MQVSNPNDQTELFIPHVDDRLVAEDDGLTSILWSRQLGENQTYHESLDDATKDSLEIQMLAREKYILMCIAKSQWHVVRLII